MFKSAFLAQLIVWNIGQGQWITEVQADRCLHYDLGGEKDVSAQVAKYCFHKMNYLLLSHWDWDHISYAARFAARIHQACLVDLPEGTASFHKRQMIERIPRCAARPKNVQVLSRPTPAPHLKSNDLSQVVVSQDFQVLIPGDSTKTQEKHWKTFAPITIQGLVLGHHGSRTSTSRDLLEQLPNLKWAVASARKVKYGHPHEEVVELLKRRRIPLLTTEDWGHLHFLSACKACIPYAGRERPVRSTQNHHRH